MADIKKKDFVKWTAKDDQGRFSHIGQITDLSKTHMEITTQRDGVLTIGLDDGTVTKIRKIKGWKEPVVVPSKKSTVTVTPRTRSGGPSKKDIAIKLYRNMTMDLGGEPSRKQAIAKFVDALGMTEAGASTYVAMAKKANK